MYKIIYTAGTYGQAYRVVSEDYRLGPQEFVADDGYRCRATAEKNASLLIRSVDFHTHCTVVKRG